MALAEKKNTDLVSEPSMHFWGITCEKDKKYAQVVGERFRITMAVLDPKSAPNDVRNKTVTLNVKRGSYEYLLCVLKHGEIHQVNLNLIFDKGENVVFFINGHGNVCLSGYALTDSERDVLNDEIGYLCPLVEVVSSKNKPENQDKSSPTKVQSESVSPKIKKKARKEKDFVTSEDRKTLKSWNAMSNKDKNGIKVLDFDDESDESDEDFSIGEESSESQDSEEFDEELEEELEEEVMTLNDDIEEEKEDEESEMESESKSGSRKRKLDKKFKPQENSFNDEDSSDSDVVAVSIGDTPIPKKTVKMENSSEKKMPKKKKKKLNEESNSPEKSVTGKSPKNIKNMETTPNKSPVVKMEGGLEIQDIIVGKGPVAIKGKMVHVFYVGRLQNKEIFDSRLPGKKPFSFKLGAQQVIKGWDIGLQGMKVGGKRKIKVPPSMGYGNSRVEDIPPNSTLFFLVELQAVS